MVNTICQLIILFFVFSIIGWCMEVILKYIQYHRFINRGFLIGPYCPIYGWGVAAVTVLVGGMFAREGTVGEIFLAGVVLCGVLEYFASWYMEKRFHARWWDYSDKPMNLHGRIWIGNLLLFGAASVLIVCWIDPIFFSLAEKLTPFWLHIIAAAIVLLFFADNIASHILMDIVRREIDAQEGDNTEEISARVHLLLQDRNLLLRRIEQAYPDLRSQPHWLTVQIHQAYREYKDTGRAVAELIHKSKRRKYLFEDDNWRERIDTALENEKNALRKFRELQKKQMQHKKDI